MRQFNSEVDIMKLQKALEKAKKNRQQAIPLNIEAHRHVAKKKPLEWSAPDYTKSTHMPIEPEKVIQNRGIVLESGNPAAESFKVLRTRVQQHVLQNNKNTILITSPIPADGKTLTIVNLAITLAKSYHQTVLLVDCDLKRQNVHKIFDLDSPAGIQDYLSGRRSMEEIIVWPGIEQLYFISGGRLPSNSAEMLDSLEMQTLINDFKIKGDDLIILFDSPPVLSGADTMVLAAYVDSIIMVVSEGQTTMDEVKRAIDLIPKEKLLGFVMNRQVTETMTNYYY